MNETKELFRFEVAYIGDAIEYLEEHLDSIKNSVTIPNTDVISDAESKLQVEKLEKIINNLMLGTVGGRAFELERGYRASQKIVAEAWQRFCEQYPDYDYT